MEFKCPICGKTYTNRKDLVACTIECDNAATAREDLEKRKKAEEVSTKIKDEFDHHYKECVRLAQELYKVDPKAKNDGWVVKWVWPSYDFFNGLGF